MIARWQKEFLLLAPAWTAAMLVALGAPQLGRVMDSMVMPFMLFALVIVLMAVVPFGREHSLQTFSLLLSEPLPRLRLWRDKVIALVVAEATAALCFWINICWLIPSVHHDEPITPWQLAWVVLLMTGVAVAGGLWATLIVRHLTAAILLTVLMPLGLLLATVLALWALQSVPSCKLLVEHEAVVAITMLCVYALAGVADSIRLFLHAEATPGVLEKEIPFLGLRGLPKWLRQQRTCASRVRKPSATWALIGKELHLQQFVLIGVAVGAGFGLACYALAALLNDTHREEVRGAVAGFAAIMAFTAPWLGGVMRIGEEKRMGTLDVQHCLPVTRRRAFLVKLVCTEAVSVAAGVVLAGMLLLLLVEPGNSRASRDFVQDLVWLGVMCPLAAAAVAFYASSAMRSLLQAFGLAAVVGALLGYALGTLASLDRLLRFWDARLLVVIGLAVGVGVLWWRSWCNYRGDTFGWRALWRDALAFLLVGLATFELLNAIALCV